MKEALAPENATGEKLEKPFFRHVEAAKTQACL